MALSPFVFVGVGGSGGKTLRVIHQVLANSLASVGWQEGWPTAWQFVHIEVAAVPDGIQPGIPFTLPITDFLPLTTPQSTYRAIDGKLSRTGRSGLDHYLAWDSWRPYPPDEVGVTISLGAGQYRAIGRVAVLNNLKAVDARIALALDASNRGREQLKGVQEAWGRENLGAGAVDRAPTILVVSSLSGGSGSGALLDVCDVIRANKTADAAEIRAVIYAPEVFEDEEGRLDPGIAPNTFMGMNELLNAWWTRGDDNAPLSRRAHFARSGVNAHRPRTGPDSVFVVGRRNGKVSLGTVDEVYRVTGRSLADLALSETQQDGLGAYSSGNADQLAAGISHLVPLAPTNDDQVTRHSNLYALGFARLSTGREYFRDYASERLAKDAVLVLLHGHRAELEQGDLRTTDETLIEQVVTREWPPFLSESKLDELGPQHNAVIDFLVPPAEVESLRKSWADAVRVKLDDEQAGTQVPIKDARAAVKAELDAALAAGESPGGVIPRLITSAQTRAIQWRIGTEGDDQDQGIQRHLSDLALAYAARDGLPVALELLDQLATTVIKAVKELREEADGFKIGFDEAAYALAQDRPSDPRRVGAEPDGYLHEILRAEASGALWYKIREEAANLAADLLEELPAKVLAPIRRAFRDALNLLKEEVDPVSGQASVFDAWPGRTEITTDPTLDSVTGVPSHLTPSKVERTLDRVDDFPVTFLELVAASTGNAAPLEALREAVEAVIRGVTLAPQLRAPDPFEHRGNWIPAGATIRRPGERQAATAVLSVRLSLDDLLTRARAWAMDQTKAIGAHIGQSVSEYLTDGLVGAAELRTRRNRLTSEFAELMNYAQPLVLIDTDALEVAHGIDRPESSLVMSPLDVPEDKALRAELAGIAQTALGHKVDLQFGPQRGETQIMTVLSKPLHLVAFRSLMEPIFTLWGASSGGGRSFWKYRRARPLLEWVPLAPASQLSLAKGWVSARLLGRVAVRQDRVDRTWRIHVDATSGNATSSGSWASLNSTGPRAVSADDGLAALFEYVATSSLEVYRDKSLSPLEPLQFLVELGAETWEGGHLSDWIATGEGLNEAGDPVLEPAATAADRVQALLDGLEQMEIRFTDHAREPMDSNLSVGALQRHSRIEVARLGIQAIEALRTQVNEVSTKAARGRF